MGDKPLMDQRASKSTVVRADGAGAGAGAAAVAGGAGPNGNGAAGGAGVQHQRKKSVIDRALDGIASVFEDKEAVDDDAEFAVHVANARKLKVFMATLHAQADMYLNHIYAFYATSYKFSQNMRAFYADNPDRDDVESSLGGAAARWDNVYKSVYSDQLAVWRTRLANVVLPSLTQHLTFFAALERQVKDRAALLKKKNHYHYKIANLRLAEKPDAARIARNTNKLAEVSREFQAAHENIASLLAGVWLSRFSFIDPLLIEFVKLQALFTGSLSQNLTGVFNDIKATLGKREAGKNSADPKKLSKEAKLQQIMRFEQAAVKHNNAVREQKAQAQQAGARPPASRAPIPAAPVAAAAVAAPAPLPAPVAGGAKMAWSCGACTFQNDAARDRCDMCNGPRPAAPAAPVVAPAAAGRPSLQAPAVSGGARRPSGDVVAAGGGGGGGNNGMMNFKQIHAAAGAAAAAAGVAAKPQPSQSQPQQQAQSADSDDEEAELDKQQREAADADDLATEVQHSDSSVVPAAAGAGVAGPGWDAKFAEPDLSIDLNRSQLPALYKLLRKLGEGSYAPTYLAENVKDGRHYVIKKIPCASLQEANNALHEAVNLCLLRFCPNICAFQDVYLESSAQPSDLGLSGGGVGHYGNGNGPAGTAPRNVKKEAADPNALFRVCIVMEYCAGGDMRMQIEHARELFTEEHVLNWLLQICTGLKVIHAANLIHRDLKPANIFLDAAGALRIGDFGVATVLHATKDLAMTHIGTPAYMAPEVLSRRPYDKKSDVWSLGCLAYEMVTLATPNFQFRTLQQVLGTVSDTFSPGLKRLIASMLQVDPNNRLSAADLLADIRALMLSARMPAAVAGAMRLHNPFAGSPMGAVSSSSSNSGLGAESKNGRGAAPGAAGGAGGHYTPAPAPAAVGRSAAPPPVAHPIGLSSASPPPGAGAAAGAAWNPLQTLPVSDMLSNLDRNLVAAAAPQPLTAAQVNAMGSLALGPSAAEGVPSAYQTLSPSPLSPGSAALAAPAISYDFAPRQSVAAGQIATLKQQPAAAGQARGSVAGAAASASAAAAGGATAGANPNRSPPLGKREPATASASASASASSQASNPFSFAHDPATAAALGRVPTAPGASPSNPFG